MYRKIYAVMVICILALVTAGVAYGAEPVKPAESDKCAVCGMRVTPYPKWIAQIVFNDGTYAVFDGPKDMFKYYFNMEKYSRHKSRNDIAAVYVTEYYTTRTVKADDDVYFITGSDVMGPMGAELVPVKGMNNAHTFMKEHKGKNMLRFGEITMKDIPMGKHMMMKHGSGDMQGMGNHDGGHGGMDH